MVIRRSTKVKFVILNAKGSKRLFFFGHSLFDQCKIRHFEFRAYIPRHIQRSTNVDVSHFERMRGRLLVPRLEGLHRMGDQRQQSSTFSECEARGCRLIEPLGHIHYLSPIATTCFPISSAHIALDSNARCPSVMSICRSTNVKITILNFEATSLDTFSVRPTSGQSSDRLSEFRGYSVRHKQRPNQRSDLPL